MDNQDDWKVNICNWAANSLRELDMDIYSSKNWMLKSWRLKVSRTCRSQDLPILTCNIHMLKTLWSFEAKPVKAPRRAKPSQMTSRRSISVPWRVKRAFNGGFTGTWRIRFVLKRCPESWIFKHNLFCSLDIQTFFFSKLSTLPTCWKTFKFRQSS